MFEKRPHGLHLVNPSRARKRARAKVKASVFAAGEAVPETAIYTVVHTQHPLPLEVTLRRGSGFPACSRCDEPVEFRHARDVDAEAAARFQVRLHVLPVVALEGEEQLRRPLALTG